MGAGAGAGRHLEAVGEVGEAKALVLEVVVARLEFLAAGLLAARGRVLTASVNAFSRMWLGVRPATALNFTDDLSGPPELLEALDSLLRLPDPQPDWDF